MTAETLRVCLLGDVQVLSGDKPVSLSGAQRLGLLALLALRAPRSLGRWEIIDALWADSPPPTAVNAVQVHVSALRKALGPGSVVIAGDGYRLGGEVAVDVAERTRLEEARLSVCWSSALRPTWSWGCTVPW